MNSRILTLLALLSLSQVFATPKAYANYSAPAPALLVVGGNAPGPLSSSTFALSNVELSSILPRGLDVTASTRAAYGYVVSQMMNRSQADRVAAFRQLKDVIASRNYPSWFAFEMTLDDGTVYFVGAARFSLVFRPDGSIFRGIETTASTHEITFENIRDLKGPDLPSDEVEDAAQMLTPESMAPPALVGQQLQSSGHWRGIVRPSLEFCFSLLRALF